MHLPSTATTLADFAWKEVDDLLPRMRTAGRSRSNEFDIKVPGVGVEEARHDVMRRIGNEESSREHVGNVLITAMFVLWQ